MTSLDMARGMRMCRMWGVRCGMRGAMWTRCGVLFVHLLGKGSLSLRSSHPYTCCTGPVCNCLVQYAHTRPLCMAMSETFSPSAPKSVPGQGTPVTLLFQECGAFLINHDTFATNID